MEVSRCPAELVLVVEAQLLGLKGITGRVQSLQPGVGDP